MPLDLQQRATQHGNWRHHTRYEIENSRLNSTAGPIKNGGGLPQQSISLSRGNNRGVRLRHSRRHTSVDAGLTGDIKLQRNRSLAQLSFHRLNRSDVDIGNNNARARLFIAQQTPARSLKQSQ